MTFTLSSPSFEPGGRIPEVFTGDGSDESPELKWSGAPAATQAYALIMDDPDAPPGTWVHWVLYDLPATAHGLHQGVPKKEHIAGGAKQGASWGVDRFERVGYGGPYPPPGPPHRYVFKLYALSSPLGLPPRATKAEVEKAMAARVIARAELIGLYGR